MNESDIKDKIKVKPCDCSAYKFPHRLDSGKCRELYNNTPLNISDYGMTSNSVAMDDAGHKESDFR